MSDTEEQTIAESSVLSKYKMSAELVNRVLKKLVTSCVAGASVRAICIEGDNLLSEELSKVFKKEKDLPKGIAFPVCISVNNCINHFSPLMSDESTPLSDGDLVKLDFGAHIDGFIAVVAHSLVVGASQENKVKGVKADAVLAAHYAGEAALRLFKPGTDASKITNAVTKVSECFKCTPIEGMVSFLLQQNCIDNEKGIPQNPVAGQQRKENEKCTIEAHEVYAMDVIVSTGTGQGRELDTRVSIYKKTDEVYNLKLKCSRDFFRKVAKEHVHMPFNLRSFEDEKKARMGVMECVTHKLVAPYPVLWEKPGEIVAQFKYTVLVMPSGPQRVTGLTFDASLYSSEIDPMENAEVKALLNASLSSRKKKKKTAKAEQPKAEAES